MWLLKYTPDDKGKYHRALLKKRGEAESSLAAEKEHLANYQHSKYDAMNGYSEKECKALVRNHVLYFEGQIKDIDNEIRLLEAPGLLCQGAVKYTILKWLGKKVDEFHHERGHLGGVSGGGCQRKIIVSTSPEHWNQEADTMVDTIRAGGWQVEVEEYEIEHWVGLTERELRKHVSIKIPVLLLEAQEPVPVAPEPMPTQPKKPEQLSLF